MNQLAHVFITYFFLSFFIPDVQVYFWPIVLFSFIVDFDHVPSYFRYFHMSKKKREKMNMKDYVDLFRTPIQEPIGIVTILLILGLLYAFGVDSVILFIAVFSILLHWVIDFLTVHTRPFSPLNNKIICLFFKTKKQRLWSEIILTVLFGILFLVVLIF